MEAQQHAKGRTKSALSRVRLQSIFVYIPPLKPDSKIKPNIPSCEAHRTYRASLVTECEFACLRATLEGGGVAVLLSAGRKQQASPPMRLPSFSAELMQKME